ncbi:unnamed protein product [Alopecurus aequalis]
MDSNATNPPSPPDAGGAGGGEKPHPLDFDGPPPPPQPVREDYVQNAVKFLSHPKVRGSAVVYRRSFLQNKGLTSDEIDEAFRRVPDPQPTAGSPPAETQPAHAASAAPPQKQPVYRLPPGQMILADQHHPRFTWYRALVAAGLLLGFGASAAVFIKKLFLPRLKSWIRRVVAESDEAAHLKHKIDEETKEAVSAIAKTNQELLASKDEEKKILVTLTQALDSQAKVLKSLSESLSHSRDSVNVTTREDRFSHYRPLEEHAPSAARNGPVNTPWRPAQQPNMYGVPNSDFGSGRPSFAPAPTEPTSGSFSRSYVEQTVQRGDRSSGSKQPWELQPQYGQPKPGYGSNSQLSDDGSYSEAQENYAPSYHQNGKAPDFHAEEPRPLAYEERPPPQRRWVPPQPPGVAMPEAAAAIRQPKSLAKQPSSDASEAAAGELQVNGGAQSSSSVAPAEAPVNGGAVSDAGRGDIEDQVEAI